MADEDKDLWTSATETETAPVAETPEATPEPSQEERTRDDRGRFAAKSVEEPVKPEPPVQQQAEPQQPAEHGIPSWRLKEEADAKREALERASRFEREVEDMRRTLAAMQKQNEPKPEAPQIWDNPDGYFDHRASEAIDPVKSEITRLREFYSQKDAIRTHGAETVKAAYDALDQAARSGDAEALAAVSRVKSSMDPFGDMVTWHKKQTIFSTIGDNPDAFFEKTLEERLSKDPQFQAKLLERIRGQAQQRPSTVTPLPPSLNRTAAAVQPEEEDDGEAGLLRTALRR